ncbi:MAG: beta-ketoacyl-ACP synthase [Burkholderiaceae bacterium]
MTPIAITAFTATTAVGPGIEVLAGALRDHRSGLAPDRFAATATGTALQTWTGRVASADDAPLPARWAAVDCRNHRLAWLALQQDGFLGAAARAVTRYGASRVAVLIGTSTSTIAESERAYRDFARTGVPPATLADGALHHLHATTAFVRDVVGATGPCSTISTACSSSAKVFAQAARMIATGLVDAAVVGGVDSLAASTLFGFHALGLVSARACRPFAAARDGISIGEAGGFALLERGRDGALLIGYGESSDAHHMSTPHPEGLGARLATEAALARAGLQAHAVDYINLHGTATPKNDAVEAALVTAMFPTTVHADATKGWTGHTLGAAGIVEAVIALIAMRDGRAPGMLDTRDPDPACGSQIVFASEPRTIGIALSNAFAFGGNNCVLAFARDADAARAARAA